MAGGQSLLPPVVSLKGWWRGGRLTIAPAGAKGSVMGLGNEDVKFFMKESVAHIRRFLCFTPGRGVATEHRSSREKRNWHARQNRGIVAP